MKKLFVIQTQYVFVYYGEAEQEVFLIFDGNNLLKIIKTNLSKIEEILSLEEYKRYFCAEISDTEFCLMNSEDYCDSWCSCVEIPNNYDIDTVISGILNCELQKEEISYSEFLNAISRRDIEYEKHIKED